MKKVKVYLCGEWVIGWTHGNTDSLGRLGVKLEKPSGPADWYLPEYVSYVVDDQPPADCGGYEKPCRA